MSVESTGVRNREAAWEAARGIEDLRWRELVTLALGTATVLATQQPAGPREPPVDLLFFVQALERLGRQEVAKRWLSGDAGGIS